MTDYSQTPAEEMAELDAREQAEKLALDTKVQELIDAGVGDHLVGVFTVIVPDQMTADWTAERIRDDARTVALGIMAQRELDLEAERLAAANRFAPAGFTRGLENGDFYPVPATVDDQYTAAISRKALAFEQELIDRSIADNEARFVRAEGQYAADAAAARVNEDGETK